MEKNYGSKTMCNDEEKREIRKRKMHAGAIYKNSERRLPFHNLIRRGSRTTREHCLESLIVPLLPHPIHLLCPSSHL